MIRMFFLLLNFSRICLANFIIIIITLLYSLLVVTMFLGCSKHNFSLPARFFEYSEVRWRENMDGPSEKIMLFMPAFGFEVGFRWPAAFWNVKMLQCFQLARPIICFLLSTESWLVSDPPCVGKWKAPKFNFSSAGLFTERHEKGGRGEDLGFACVI